MGEIRLFLFFLESHATIRFLIQHSSGNNCAPMSYRSIFKKNKNKNSDFHEDIGSGAAIELTYVSYV